jgi:hypothetical protein
MLEFIHTPSLLVVLNEMNAGYRQVFTDARKLPQSLPAWGYSSAKWSGDTLVITRSGCATTPGSVERQRRNGGRKVRECGSPTSAISR